MNLEEQHLALRKFSCLIINNSFAQVLCLLEEPQALSDTVTGYGDGLVVGLDVVLSNPILVVFFNPNDSMFLLRRDSITQRNIRVLLAIGFYLSAKPKMELIRSGKAP